MIAVKENQALKPPNEISECKNWAQKYKQPESF